MLLKTVTHSEIKLTEQSQVARRLLTIACTVCVGREPIRCTEQLTLHSFFLLLFCLYVMPRFHGFTTLSCPSIKPGQSLSKVHTSHSSKRLTGDSQDL